MHLFSSVTNAYLLGLFCDKKHMYPLLLGQRDVDPGSLWVHWYLHEKHGWNICGVRTNMVLLMWPVFLHFYWICLSRRELMHQTKTQATIKEKNLRLNVETKPIRKSTKLRLQQPWIHIEYQQTMMCMTCSNRSQYFFIWTKSVPI